MQSPPPSGNLQALRVIRVVPRTLPFVGGVEVHVEELSKALADLGIHQEILYSEGDPRTQAVPHQVRAPRMFGTLIHDAVFSTRLQWSGRSMQADVVHSHGDGFVAAGAARLARRLTAAHVHTVHGGLTADKTKRPMIIASYPKASRYIAVSTHIANQLAEIGIPPAQVSIRTSGVRDVFLTIPGKPRSGVVVGGRLVPGKRVLEFTESLRSDRAYGVNIRVFGDGPDAARIQKSVASLDATTWFGRLDADGVATLLSESDVGLVMSAGSGRAMHPEGTPSLGLEMLAAGCLPMVSGEVGELRALVRQLDPRLDLGSSLPARQHLVDVLGRYPEGHRLREQARATARLRFAWRSVALEVLDIYKDAIDAHPRK